MVDHCPEFILPVTGGTVLDSATLQGQAFVLYLYPKDNTPGCTKELKDFSDHAQRFAALGVSIYGVSRDSVGTHERFKAKHDGRFELISDPEGVLCHALGVIQMKLSFGKRREGIVRSTFLFDQQGRLHQHWSPVKVAGHAAAVLAAAEAMGVSA